MEPKDAVSLTLYVLKELRGKFKAQSAYVDKSMSHALIVHIMLPADDGVFPDRSR